MQQLYANIISEFFQTSKNHTKFHLNLTQLFSWCVLSKVDHLLHQKYSINKLTNSIHRTTKVQRNEACHDIEKSVKSNLSD